MFKHKNFYTQYEGLIFLKISEYCNIECSFCYQNAPNGSKMNSEEKLQRTLDSIDHIIRRQQAYSERVGIEITPTFVLFGGEPMTNIWGIHKICEHIKKKYYDNMDYRITITTNGTLFDEETMRVIRSSQKRPLSLMMSVDLDKGTCDVNRKFKIGGSVYESIQTNIDRYVDLLNEINGKPGIYLQLASVAATLGETVKKMQETIDMKNASRKLKATLGGLKLHHDNDKTNKEIDVYLKEYSEFYEDKFINIIKNNSLSKTDVMNVMDLNVVHLGAMVNECYGIWTINSNGYIEYCNNNKTRPDGVVDTQWMEDRVFAEGEEETSFFECTKNKTEYGNRYKSAAKKRLFKELKERYTIDYWIDDLVIDVNLDKNLYAKINKWIKGESVVHLDGTTKLRVNFDAKHIIDKDIHHKIDFTKDILISAAVIKADGKMLMNMLVEGKYLTDFNKPYYEWLDSDVLKQHREFNSEVVKILNGEFNKENIPTNKN